ncbi:facilitated trehalose transporter Tret1-like [Ochlerotatus camptorhynchus]|uniref:facilitated trehalose transporter Tret1-like n=1 Tax=Ochlerotatus camptorhynchus TaxID=644619 RepID=UPI0031D6A4A3
MIDPQIQLESHETFWIVAVHLFGALLGPFVAGFLVIRIGPRSLLMSCVIPAIINWVMIGYSRSVAVIYVARAIAGIVYGTVVSTSPIYLEETLPESIKYLSDLFLILFGAAIGLLVCSTYFTIDTQAQYSSAGWIAFLGLITYIILFNLGINSLPSTIIEEIFSPNLYLFVTGMFAIMNYLMSIGLAKIFQSTLFMVGVHVSFWIFTISAAVCALLVYAFVPETKNLTFEEARQAVADKAKINGPSYACIKVVNPCKVCVEDDNN